MGRVTRSTTNSKVTTRSRKSNLESSINNKPQSTKKKVSVNKTSPLKNKRKRNAVDYAEVTLRKSTPQAKAKNLPIYKREVAFVRENKINDVFEFDLKEVKKAEKCNASYISDNEFDKDIQQDIKDIKKRILTKKKETNKQKLLKTANNKSIVKVNKKQNVKVYASKDLKIKNKSPTKLNKSSGKMKQVAKLNTTKDLNIKNKTPASSNKSTSVLIQKENKKHGITETSILKESTNPQSTKYSPKQIVILDNLILKSPSNTEDNIGTNISCDPNYSIPNFSDTSSDNCKENSNGTACNSPKDDTFKVPEYNVSSNIMNSPWRPNFIVRNSPRYMTTKNSNLPIYNQDAVINSTIIENTFQNCNKTKKTLKQKSMLDYVTGGAANEESFNCSLFDIDQLSPIKKVSDSPIVNKANSNKKVRKPLGLWNNNDAVSVSQEDVDENSSLHFGFDKSDKENVPITGKPTRFTGFEVKKRNVFAHFIDPIKKQDLGKDNTVNDQNTIDESLGTQPVVGLFEDLETEPKAPPRASYGRRFPKRARFVEVEEEEEPEDETERIKRRKKDQRTKAEEIAAKKWEDEFNEMCAEIDKHELEIEAI